MYNYVTKNSSWIRKHPNFLRSKQQLQNQAHHCSEAHSNQHLQIIQSLHQMDSLLSPVQATRHASILGQNAAKVDRKADASKAKIKCTAREPRGTVLV